MLPTECYHPTATDSELRLRVDLEKNLLLGGADIFLHKVMDFVFEECLLRRCKWMVRKSPDTRSWTACRTFAIWWIFVCVVIVIPEHISERYGNMFMRIIIYASDKANVQLCHSQNVVVKVRLS